MKVAIYRTREFRGVNARLEVSYHKLSASFVFAGDYVYVDRSINDLSRNLIWINAHEIDSIAGLESASRKLLVCRQTKD
jgi:hypothetical protein